MLSPDMLAAMNGAGPNTGFMGDDVVAELQKALTAGYGTDVSTLQGGGALRIQSLDRTMQTTIQENKHFRLFNKMPKPKAGATVDEWTEQNSVGGFLGGSTNSETGNIAAFTGNYNRRVGLVKYLMTQRQVSFVTTLQNGIADAQTIEYQNGALQLLSDAEYLSFAGDSTVVPTEFDGIKALLEQGIAAGLVDGANIIDVQSKTLASVNAMNIAAQQIAHYGNFGTPTDLFCSTSVQADFDTGLDPAFRVPLNDVPGGGTQIGAPVVGIRTSYGNIANQPDVFIVDQDQLAPFAVLQPVAAAANAAQMPAAVAGVAATDPASMFGAPQAGNYYYYVEGVTAAGGCTGRISAQVAVAAGQSVTLTITPSAAGGETGYAIYRSRLNGPAVLAGSIFGQGSDFRLVRRIPRNMAGATTYLDQSRDIPGCLSAYVLNLAPGASALLWRQLLPMIKFNLYPTVSAVIPWAQLLFGYLRISKRRQHVVIKNILPSGAVWRPFNV